MRFLASVPEITTVFDPERNESHWYDESAPFRVGVDGVNFLDGRYHFGGRQSPKFMETAAIGDCAPAEVCDTKTESLFDLQLETSSGSRQIWWTLDYANATLREMGSVATSSDIFDGILSNSSYRTYQCVLKKEDLMFEIRADSGFRCTLSLDGVVMETIVCEGPCARKIFLYQSRTSSGTISAGVIAMIVAASVAGLALIACFRRLNMLRSASRIEPQEEETCVDEEDPSEDETGGSM